MAKKEYTFDEICRDIKSRRFSPVYVLMGEEPFFIDKLTDLLMATVLDESEKDFNQLLLYGAHKIQTSLGSLLPTLFHHFVLPYALLLYLLRGESLSHSHS